MIKDTTLVLDVLKAKANIKKMTDKAHSLNLELRPHFKTHQSHMIGKWFRESGVYSITVSSLKMARYFANDGWDNITIAFPINILDLKEIDELASQIDLRVLATKKEILQKINSKLKYNLGVYIDLDPGYHRSGLPILDFNKLKELKDYILSASNLRFEGFYSHAGHSYKCRSIKEIETLSCSIFNKFQDLKEVFNDPICFGDTPSCSVLENFGKVDQISPGNFVFYDWTQVNIGSCDSNEISIAMYCPIVDKNPGRNELLIHGGAVHFSKDSLQDNNGEIYFGVVAEKNVVGWGDPVPQNILKSISQEHGIVRCTDGYFNTVSVGDIIPIIPIHSCLTADLMGEYYSTSGSIIDHMNLKVFR